MKPTGSLVVLLLELVVAGSGAAQARDVRAELAARGAPADFVERVGATVDATLAQGLPPEPLIDKALEGWAKRGRVPPERVLAVLEQVRERLVEGRAATVRAGMADPPGAVVAAAAEALGRGMTPEDVRDVVSSAPGAEAAAAGLTVAASLCAQGLDRAAAVRAVRDVYRAHADPGPLFELPSAVADMTGRGIPMADVARRIMQGGGLPLPPMAGQGAGQGRPGSVPPGRGNKGSGHARRQ
jgi:hypothetical protein